MSAKEMFEVIRVKNDNKTVIENLGVMDENELFDFAKHYIGNDLAEWGNIFIDEEDILSDIEYIKKTGNELWFETEDTNLKINYINKEE